MFRATVPNIPPGKSSSSAIDMFTVSFVCLGNICRSPMAEAVFKRLARERGFSSSVCVQSFATSNYEEGNPVYPPAARTLKEHGIEDFAHRSRQIRLADIKNSDYVLVMDYMNMRDIVRMTAGLYGEKIMMLGHFLNPPRDISDPYYTRDFEKAFGDITAACEEFCSFLQSRHGGAFAYDKSRLP